MKKLCALIIGHKQKSPGVMNTEANISEFEFNEELAKRIQKEKLDKADIIRMYRRTYKSLPDDINELAPDFAISLQCNSFKVNQGVSGSEVFYYHRSQQSKILAEFLLNNFLDHLQLPDRGLQPVTAEGRNGYLLKYTNCPIVIAAPFFIDNYEDLSKVLLDTDNLAMAYVKAIEEFAGCMDELLGMLEGFHGINA